MTCAIVLKSVRSLSQLIGFALLGVVAPISSLSVPSMAMIQSGGSLQDPTVQSALSAIDQIVGESKGYDDPALRIRVRSHSADIIWPFEPERARELIRSAFEETKDIKSNVSDRYSLRREVLAIARRRDPELARQLMERVSGVEDGSTEVMRRDSFEQISERGALLLDSAKEALRSGNVRQALLYAKLALGEGRSAEFLSFLRELRQRDQAAADRLFLNCCGLLAETSSDPNDVLQIGLYLFSDDRRSVSEIDGQVIVSHGIDFKSAPAPAANLIGPYLLAAERVLERFSLALQQNSSIGARELQRFALQQLLPLFDRYEPGRAVALRAQLEVLNASSPTLLADPSTVHMVKPVTAGDLLPPDDPSEIDRRAQGSKDRDAALFDATIRAVSGENFERARELLSGISETDTKSGLLEFVSLREALKAIESGRLEEAETIAKTRLSEDRRATVYYQLGLAWFARGDNVRATEDIDAAAQEAKRIRDASRRARIYLYVAAGLASRDVSRAFEFVELAAKDVNDSENFDINRTELTLSINRPSSGVFRFAFSPGGSVLDVAPVLARSDFIRMNLFARSLRSPEARAEVILAACRGVLVEVKKNKESDKPAAARKR
jgi:tetratricopeptide (TPR) repeat protein